ncbi:MAG: UDP-N-acetyl glucosamine 2-epimerase [Bacteroidota bacterium]|nr:MAG: UDP-N-acetyl glucosamine 2-epimerase [Bacteroidota bacterium]
MKKIVVIVGTRPEAIKLIPVYRELKKQPEFVVQIISTGQHKEMLDSIFNFFQVVPNRDLKLMAGNQTLDELTAALLSASTKLFKEITPDLVVVQGDTTTAMVCALAAFYQRIQIAHVEAGLRSFDIQAPFPEEVNRKIISSIASLNFAPTHFAALNLKREVVAGKVWVTGNTVIDSLLLAKKKIAGNMAGLENLFSRFLKDYKRMILITGHRRENFGDGFKNICNSIKTLAKRFPDHSFVYPVHLNPNVRTTVFAIIDAEPNVFLLDPVPYDQMVFLMMRAHIILTDSGGIQEEAPSLGKPVLIMRSKTERPEGIKAGCSKLVGTSEEKIVGQTSKLLTNAKTYQKMAKSKKPFGKGDSSKLIVEHIKKYFDL